MQLTGAEVRGAAVGLSLFVLGLCFLVFALVAVVFFTISHNCFWTPPNILQDEMESRSFTARVFANGKLRPVKEKCIKVTIDAEDDDGETIPDDL